MENIVYKMTEKKDIKNIIYLLYDYYLTDDLQVNLDVKTQNRIVLILKNTKLPTNYKNVFNQIIYVKTIDYEETKKIVENFLQDKEEKKTLVVSSFEKFNKIAIRLRKDFKIPGFGEKEMLKLYNKVEMKNILKKKNMPVHLFEKVDKKKIKKDIKCYILELEKKISYPMFQKPTEFWGSNFTKKIKNRKDLTFSLKKIIKQKHKFEIDKFISDKILNCDFILIEGKIVFFRTRVQIGGLRNFSKGKSNASIIIPPNCSTYKKALKVTKIFVEGYKQFLGNKCINLELIETEGRFFVDHGDFEKVSGSCSDNKIENDFDIELEIDQKLKKDKNEKKLDKKEKRMEKEKISKIDKILNNENDLLFLEFNYRRAGCYGTYIFDFNYKNNFNYENIDLALTFGTNEISIPKEDFESDYEFYSASVLYTGTKTSIVKDINVLPEELNSELKTFFKIKIGEKIVKTPNLDFIPAVVILRNQNFYDLYKDVEILLNWYPYIFE